MKLTADQYYYVYFCMLEEPAMFKPLSYSSEFVSIRQPFVLSTDNANFQAKNIRAGSPDLFMSMLTKLLVLQDVLGSKFRKYQCMWEATHPPTYNIEREISKEFPKEKISKVAHHQDQALTSENA